MLIGALLPVVAWTQIPKPAQKQKQSILILNATAHLGNGEVIKRAAVGFSEGKIDMVLSAIDIRMDSTKYDTIIHAEGQHLYPGFIAPNSRLGLVEIDAVRASRDYDDVGQFNPHVRALTAFNTESRITPTVRTNGVLLAQVTPKGGRISGSSSIFYLEGWNWEDAVIKEDDGIHMNWPSYRKQLVKKATEKGKKSPKDNYKEETRAVNDFFLQAQAYAKDEFPLEKNLRFEAMKPLFSKEAKLFVHANRVQELTDAIYFADRFNLEMVVVGGYEAPLVADLLKDKSIPILLRRVHSLPRYEDDDIDLPFRLASTLHKKGILVGLENSGSMEAMGSRNLPFYAGTVAAYGVDVETALSMISLNTAKILGIDLLLGSVEKGKLATLFISEGDALDMRTNNVVSAFVEGKQISLDNPQKALYRKYSDKYKQ
ncbi:MAG: amidohydrolase [Verrucomicrobia bacterium]|nr:amidohydrolase [Verrucomicrobiota bacterium]